MSLQWREGQHWAKGLRRVDGSKISWRGLGLIKPNITNLRSMTPFLDPTNIRSVSVMAFKPLKSEANLDGFG